MKTLEDTIEFEAVDVEALRRTREAVNAVRQPPRIIMPNGDVLEQLNEMSGSYKITDLAGNPKGYAHAEHVLYRPSLTEQFLASRDTVPRLPTLKV